MSYSSVSSAKSDRVNVNLVLLTRRPLKRVVHRFHPNIFSTSCFGEEAFQNLMKTLPKTEMSELKYKSVWKKNVLLCVAPVCSLYFHFNYFRFIFDMLKHKLQMELNRHLSNISFLYLGNYLYSVTNVYSFCIIFHFSSNLFQFFI